MGERAPQEWRRRIEIIIVTDDASAALSTLGHHESRAVVLKGKISSVGCVDADQAWPVILKYPDVPARIGDLRDHAAGAGGIGRNPPRGIGDGEIRAIPRDRKRHGETRMRDAHQLSVIIEREDCGECARSESEAAGAELCQYDSVAGALEHRSPPADGFRCEIAGGGRGAVRIYGVDPRECGNAAERVLH